MLTNACVRTHCCRDHADFVHSDFPHYNRTCSSSGPATLLASVVNRQWARTQSNYTVNRSRLLTNTFFNETDITYANYKTQLFIERTIQHYMNTINHRKNDEQHFSHVEVTAGQRDTESSQAVPDWLPTDHMNRRLRRSQSGGARDPLKVRFKTQICKIWRLRTFPTSFTNTRVF